MKGITDHASKAYDFSHFIPCSDSVQPQLLFKADKGIKTLLLAIVDIDLLSNISDLDLDLEEEDNHHDSNIEFTP